VPVTNVVLDDRLLIEELLTGLPELTAAMARHTTPYWYYRACRAAVAGAGGHLSGPFEQLDLHRQQQAILSLLELRDDVSIARSRDVVPRMATLSIRHPRLNLLNLEVVATAQLLAATVWLSEPAAAGVLPPILEAENVAWSMIQLVAPPD
jgi:hypothetical protein